MAINIKDPETDRLARELAELSGLPITAAVREAIVVQLGSLRRRSVADVPALDDIIIRGRQRQTLDTRSTEDILGYDEHGLPG